MSLLKQDITIKKWVNEKLLKSDKFDTGDHKEYKVKTIIDNAVYGHKAENQLLALYYLVS